VVVATHGIYAVSGGIVPLGTRERRVRTRSVITAGVGGVKGVWLVRGDVGDGAGEARDGHVCRCHVIGRRRLHCRLQQLVCLVVAIWVFKEVPLVNGSHFLFPQSFTSVELQEQTQAHTQFYTVKKDPCNLPLGDSCPKSSFLSMLLE